MGILNTVTYIDNFSNNKVTISTDFIETALFNCDDTGSDPNAVVNGIYTLKVRVIKIGGPVSTEQLYLQVNFVNIGIQTETFVLENVGDYVDLVITQQMPNTYIKDIVIIFTGVCNIVKYVEMNTPWILTYGSWEDTYIWKDTEFWQDN